LDLDPTADVSKIINSQISVLAEMPMKAATKPADVIVVVLGAFLALFVVLLAGGFVVYLMVRRPSSPPTAVKAVDPPRAQPEGPRADLQKPEGPPQPERPNPFRQPEGPPAAAPFIPKDMQDAYRRNPVVAKAKHEGKRWRFSGWVQKISDSGVVLFVGAGGYVGVKFEDGQIELLETGKSYEIDALLISVTVEGNLSELVMHRGRVVAALAPPKKETLFKVGERVILTNANKLVPIGGSSPDLESFQRAVAEKDEATSSQLIAERKVFQVATGTIAEITEVGYGGYWIRVMAGPHKDRSGYVAAAGVKQK
jgi:hypothetical protein